MKLFLTYLKELFKFGRAGLLLNTALMILLGLTEGVGILLLAPLLSAAGILTSDMDGGITALLSGFRFGSLGMTSRLLIVLGIFLAINVLQSFLHRFQSINKTKIQNGFNSYLSVRLFQKLAYAKWIFLVERAKSDITHIMTTELARVSVATQQFMNLTASSIIALFQLILALWISPIMTLFVVVSGALFMLATYPSIRKSRQMGMDISEYTRGQLFELTEHLNGIKEIKSYGMEQNQTERFRTLRHNIDQSNLKFQKLTSRTDMIYKIGSAVLICVFLLMAIVILGLNAQEFILITVVFTRLWPRLSSFQVNAQTMAMMMPAFEFVMQMEKDCDKEREKLNEKSSRLRMELNDRVEFRDVSFSYKETVDAISGISLILPVGTTTALVGRSGSGKSTLADLLLGLLDPACGQIFVDGKLLGDDLMAWRNSVGYVPQEPFLFHATIRENLLWLTPDASEQDIAEALKMASADEFVRNFPEGLDTIVGDKGIRLSGGERQRIVLARTLLRKPEVLILDEATSSLDTANEQRIRKAIDSLKGKMTILIVAHRLSTIRNADRIIVLDQGSIAEEGSYSSLLERKGLFYQLVASDDSEGAAE